MARDEPNVPPDINASDTLPGGEPSRGGAGRDDVLVAIAAGGFVAVVVAVARWVSLDAALVVAPATVTAIIVLTAIWVARRQAARARRVELRLRQRILASSTRIERRVTRATDDLFGQLEALAAVRDAMSGAVPLPPTRGWAASPDVLREVVAVILRERPRVVVELGSGTSTIAIAACLRRLGSGHLWSLEHLPEFAASVRGSLAALDLQDLVTVVDAPLVATRVGDEEWSWYDTSGLRPAGPIDALLVDGPPNSVGPMARYPALSVLAARLADRVAIIVDDAARPQEQKTVARWQAETPGLSARYVAVEKGAYVLVRDRVPDSDQAEPTRSVRDRVPDPDQAEPTRSVRDRVPDPDQAEPTRSVQTTLR